MNLSVDISDEPDDDMVLATAKAAQAQLIVSGDRHLLRLGSFEGVEIVSIAAALSLHQAR